MLIVALLGAFVFYVGLYLLWSSSQVPLNSLDALLRALDQMLWLRDGNLVFVIFRGLLMAATAYVVLDLFISATKRATKRKDDKEKNELSWKKPPRVDPFDPTEHEG